MASLRAAVNAFCKSCIYDGVGGFGTWRQQVQACTSYKCPLHAVRPIAAGPRAAEMARFSAGTPRSAPGQYLDADELECRRCGWRWHVDNPAETACPNCAPQA